MVDPPSGWQYGFPRPYDFEPSHPNLPGEEYRQEVREWWRDTGYPSKDIDFAIEHSRYWEENS